MPDSSARDSPNSSRRAQQSTLVDAASSTRKPADPLAAVDRVLARQQPRWSDVSYDSPRYWRMGDTDRAARHGLMDDLDRAHRSVVEAEKQLRRNVTEARRRGLTWADIGEALGVSKQAAAKRFRNDRGLVAYDDQPLPER